MGNDDELTGIFNDLKPEDFFGTAARDIKGKTFDAFVDDNIQTIQVAYLAASGELDPIAILATATKEWTYTPNDEETLGEYLHRLTDEAKRLGATRMFLIKATLVGTDRVLQNEAPTVGEVENIEEGIRNGQVTMGVFYYAQTKEGPEVRRRVGIMRGHGNRLGEPVEPSTAQAVPNWDEILG